MSNYIDQKEKWLASHPDATMEEAWEAGYLQSTDNWCNGYRGRQDGRKLEL